MVEVGDVDGEHKVVATLEAPGGQHPDDPGAEAPAPHVVGQLQIDAGQALVGKRGGDAGQVHLLDPAVADRDPVVLDDEHLGFLRHPPVDGLHLGEGALSTQPLSANHTTRGSVFQAATVSQSRSVRGRSTSDPSTRTTS